MLEQIPMSSEILGFRIGVSDRFPVRQPPVGITNDRVTNSLIVLTLNDDRYRQPRWPIRRLDTIPVSPVPSRILHVVIKYELVHGVNKIKVTLPRNIVGLNDSDPLVHF